MADDVTFIDNTIRVQTDLADLAYRALEETSGELEVQVRRNTRVDTGQLKNSWQHSISEGEGQFEAQIGSPLENAIWEEYGTGEYALEGNGRKGGWYYEDARGDGHFTHGKHPSRAFYKAYTSLKTKIIAHIQDVFKGGI